MSNLRSRAAAVLLFHTNTHAHMQNSIFSIKQDTCSITNSRRRRQEILSTKGTVQQRRISILMLKLIHCGIKFKTLKTLKTSYPLLNLAPARASCLGEHAVFVNMPL